MAAENKVIFGLSRVHYAIITEDAMGVHTYSTPKELKGATELSIEPKGETADFYADNVLFYTSTSNQGYEATLTCAYVTPAFRTDVLGEVLDAVDKVIIENTFQNPKKIAFLFEFDGDVKATRFCLYNCTISRPTISSATKTDTTEPQTQELRLVAAPRPSDGRVKAATTADATPAVYDGWYAAVYE